MILGGMDSPLGAGFEIVGEQRWGGHADLVVVPGRNVVSRPSDRSWEECAAYPLATLTAWRMLRRARVTAGESVLIVGIGGGVSTAALALAGISAADAVVATGAESDLETATSIAPATTSSPNASSSSPPIPMTTSSPLAGS